MRSSGTFAAQQYPLSREGTTTSSAVFADSVDSDPSQHDAALFAATVASIKAEATSVKINRRQTQLMVKRLLAVAETLRKLPDYRPTPLLLVTFQSADWLFKGMSRSPVWEHQLRERFLCQDQFSALRERLRAAWQLHSTVQWEQQDVQAAREDERANAALLLSSDTWRRPTVGDLTGAPMDGDDGNHTVATAAAVVEPHGHPPRHTHEVEEQGSSPLTPSESVYPEAALAAESVAGGASAGVECPIAEVPCHPNAVAATEGDLISFYCRRRLSSWKLRYEDLDRLTDVAGPTVAFSASRTPPDPPLEEGAAAGGAAAALASRFRVAGGFLFHGHPVVVKELQSTPSSQQQRLLTPYTVTSFVQDAVARARWCHPGLVHCYGAYTERFLTPAEEARAREEAAAAGLPLFPLLPGLVGEGGRKSPAQANDIAGSQAATRKDFHHRSALTSLAISSKRLAPIMALGLVMEDLSFCAKSESSGESRCASEDPEGSAPPEDCCCGGGGGGWGIHGCTHTPEARTPTGFVDPALPSHPSLSQERFVCLQDLLFTDGEAAVVDGSARLSLLDSLDIVTQVGEAVQYILPDRFNVPPEVCTAWLSIAPSNLFVATAPSPQRPRNRPTTGSSSQPGSLAVPSPFAMGSNTVERAGIQQLQHQREGNESTAFLGAGMSNTSSVVLAPSRADDLSGSGGERAAATAAAVASSEFSQFPMPYVLVSEAKSSALPRPRPSLRVACTYLPVPMREAVLVKYAPPTFIDDGPCSRWRPHPKAVSPPCYALAQLCLALLTGQPPYRSIRQQKALRRQLLCGGESSHEDGAAATAPSVRVSQVQGYAMPQSLPLPLRALLRMAMSFRPLTAGDFLVEKHRDLASGPCLPSTDPTSVVDGDASLCSSWDYAGGVKEAEEDCAYLLSRLQCSSSNTATNSTAAFADSGAGAAPPSDSASVPRVLTMQLFMEGLAVVRDLLVRRRVCRGERLDLSKDLVYGRNRSAQSRSEQRQSSQPPEVRYANPNSVEVEVAAVKRVASRVTADRRAFDDYGEV